MDTRVYSYGAKAPTKHGDEVSEQIYRAHRYRNDLCALERRRRERVTAEMRKYFPEVEQLTLAVEAAEKELDAARTEQKKRNARERNRKVGAEAKKQMDALRENRNKLYGRLKAAKSAAFGPDEVIEARKAYGKVRGKIQDETKKKDVSDNLDVAAAKAKADVAEARWFAAVPTARAWRDVLARIDGDAADAAKKLYADADMGWGTKLGVMTAADKFRKGAPPQFKRFRGDGSIGVQVQGRMPIRDALEATKGQLGIDGYDPERKKQKSSVRIRIGTTEENRPIFTTVPVTFHRALPEDAEIAWAHLARRRIGTHDRYRVNFTLQRNRGWEKPKLADRGEVGIDVGWRLVKGGLRVAYWVGNDGRKGELVLPQKLLDGMRYPDEIRSDRDDTYNGIKSVLHGWLSEQWGVLPEWLRKRSAKADKDDPEALPDRPTVATWKSQARLASLALHWFENRFEGDAEIFAKVESWRKWDKLKFNAEAHGRDKHIAHRREIYRVFAARMREDYARCFIEDIDWSKLKKNPEAEQESQPGAVKENQRIASPGLLHEILIGSMRKTVKRDAKDTTRRHHACGEYSGEPNPELLHHTCAACGAIFDQDENSAMNLLSK